VTTKRRAPRQPPGACRLVVVLLALGADQDVGQLARPRPGVDDGIGGDLGAQHFADGAQQAVADHRVVLRQHLHGHVLVDDLRGQRPHCFQAVDMAGVHQHAIGQCARLVAAGLVGG
jgi:hypothetical protein